jgi:hypothetical protein
MNGKGTIKAVKWQREDAMFENRFARIRYFTYFCAMTRFLIPLLIASAATAQNPLPVNRHGEVTDDSLGKLIKQRGYEAVSAFDTVWKKPMLVYAQYVKGGKFGILDIDGKEITPAVYDKIDGLDRSITSNLFAYPRNYVVKQDGRYGLISNTGKKLIPPTYRYLFGQSRDPLHYKVTADDGKEWFVDENGRTANIKEDDPDAERQEQIANRKPETQLSKNGKKYHLRHSWTGMETTVPNLGEVRQNFGSTVAFKNAENKIGLYNLAKKKMVIPFEYDEIKLAYKGYYDVRLGKLHGVMDSIGQLKIPVAYEYLSVTSGGMSAYANRTYTIYSTKLEKLSDMGFERTGYMGAKGLTLVHRGKFGLMSPEGKILAPFEYDAMDTPEDHDLKFSIILAKKNGKYAVMDFNGKLYTDFIYDSIVPESLVFSDSKSLEPVFNGYANQPNMFYYVKAGDRYGLIDDEFKTLIEPVFDYFLESPDRTVLLAKKNGKWGMIDVRTQKPIIPFEYERPIEYKSGNYQVFKNGQYGLMSRDGKFLIPPGDMPPLESEKIYNGLWRLSDYAKRTSFYLDYAGRRTQPVQWPKIRN